MIPASWAALATDHSVVAGAVGSFSAGSLVPVDQLFHGPAVMRIIIGQQSRT